MRKRLGVIFGLFLISRVYILSHPPVIVADPEQGITGSGYSDVKQDYERYANMWHYGLTPYLKHFYEYPPAAIVFTYVPLWIDLQGLGYYYQNYRIQIFLVETIFFWFLVYFTTRSPLPPTNKNFALGFYILSGVVAKDFWYDGLDLVFVMSLASGLMFRQLVGYTLLWQKVVFWSFFWLSVAIKLLTLPLALPLLALSYKKWRQEIIAITLGFIIVWGVPLLLFRSSLSVFLVFHGERPLKYEAFGSFVIRTINDFTHTEIQSDIKPHFPMIGPVSQFMEKATSITFPMALLAVLLIYSFRFIKEQSQESLKQITTIVLMFLFTLFLSSKVLSRPFHIWYVPFICLFPFASRKEQLIAMGMALWMLTLDTSQYLKFPQLSIGQLAFDRVRDFLRFLPMAAFLRVVPHWKAVKV
jgi:hypothetical protein